MVEYREPTRGDLVSITMGYHDDIGGDAWLVIWTAMYDGQPRESQYLAILSASRLRMQAAARQIGLDFGRRYGLRVALFPGPGDEEEVLFDPAIPQGATPGAR